LTDYIYKPEPGLKKGALTLPARIIPVPNSISHDAQKVLEAIAMRSVDIPPSADDREAWMRYKLDIEVNLLPSFRARAARYDVQSKQMKISGVNSYVSTPPTTEIRFKNKIYFDVHGGAFVVLAGEPCRAMGAAVAGNLGLKTVSVDYRMPPDHPYPAALDDCIAVYRSLVEEYGATNIVAGGNSAGGNIVLATMLRARDEGLPLPAGLALLSPEVDLTESGDTFTTNNGIDFLQRPRITAAIQLYANGYDLMNPYLSPLFGDFRGFPRCFIQSGTRDMFLSNSVRLHRALRKVGVDAELHIWEAMPHGVFVDVPEEAEVNMEVQQFVSHCFQL